MTRFTDGRNENAYAGKLRRMQRLSDADNRFAMLAIDQRVSLRKLFAAKFGIPPSEVTREALAVIKEVVTSSIAPYATAVLTDPLHGYPSSARAFPPNVGLLLAIEVSGYDSSVDGERLSRLIDGWSPRAISRAGADAVKLLLWHRPDAAPETSRHQEALVERVGAECADEGLPFVLEVVTYPPTGQNARSTEFARAKPEMVVEAAEHYSNQRFGVDLLKVQFPGDLKYVEEYQTRDFAADEVIYDLAEVEANCRRLNDASRVPWVILSAGVDPDEFIEILRIANTAGASGFLCGRAVWKHVVDPYPDIRSMRRFAENTAREYFIRIRKANDGARPWSQHPHYLHS